MRGNGDGKVDVAPRKLGEKISALRNFSQTIVDSSPPSTLNHPLLGHDMSRGFVSVIYMIIGQVIWHDSKRCHVHSLK